MKQMMKTMCACLVLALSVFSLPATAADGLTAPSSYTDVHYHDDAALPAVTALAAAEESAPGGPLDTERLQAATIAYMVNHPTTFDLVSPGGAAPSMARMSAIGCDGALDRYQRT